MSTLRARQQPFLTLLVLLIGALGPTGVQASPGDRIERHPFFASTIFTSLEDHPSVATDLRGDTVIVWASLEGSTEGIWARRFAPNGEPRGEQFRAGIQPPGFTRYESPVIAMDADGDFVIAWFVEGFRLAPSEIQAQRFSSDGQPQGDAFTVSSVPFVGTPEIAMNAAGDFVMVWTVTDINENRVDSFAQRYNRLALPQGSPIRVNQTSEPNLFTAPRVAMNAAGDFAVVWLQIQGSLPMTVQSRRFTANGHAVGDERTLVTTGPGLIADVVAAMDAQGTLLVAYHRFENSGPFGSQSLGIFARLFGPQGRPWSRELTVSRPEIVPFRGEVSADMDTHGDFAITWIGNESPEGGATVLSTRLFNRFGFPLTSPRQFSFPELGFDPRQSAVAMDGRGNFTVVWQMGTLNPDGSGQGPNILGQRFAGPRDNRASCAHFIATRTGTRHADLIRGTTGDDVIHAGGGNDFVAGGGGDDVVCGGAGDDQLFGEDGNDWLLGGTGDDVLDGGPGTDTCRGQDAVNGDTEVQCE